MGLTLGLPTAKGQPPSVSPSSPPVTGDFQAVGDWVVAPNGQVVLVTLECAAFINRNANQHVADTTLRLAPVSTSGTVSGNVVQAEDSTNLASNQSEAAVSAMVSGIGVASFRLEASIDPQDFPASGAYDTTISATLTAP